MENKLACKRDSEHNTQAAMPLAARILCKMSKKRDYNSFALHFSCPAFWWQSNSFGWSTKVWHAVHVKFCCNVCLLQETPMVHEICCSIWNSDLVTYLSRVQPFEQAEWKLLRSHRPGFSCNLSHITLTVKLGKLP